MGGSTGMTQFLYYNLELANGIKWVIGISREIGSWGRSFASLLELDGVHDGTSRMIYILPPMDAGSERTFVENFFLGEMGIASNNVVTYQNRRIKFFYDPQSRNGIGILANTGENNSIQNMVAAMFCIYIQVLEKGGLPLHGALLFHPDLQGFGILAASGTGKSTCAQRIPHPWYAPSDDIFLAIQTRTNEYYGHPVPTWSEYLWGKSCNKTWNISHGFPLNSIFFLEQGESDSVIPFDRADAALMIYKSAFQVLEYYMVDLPKHHRIQISMMLFSNACALARRCRTFILKASLQGNYWEEIEGTLRTRSAEGQYPEISNG